MALWQQRGQVFLLAKNMQKKRFEDLLLITIIHWNLHELRQEISTSLVEQVWALMQ